MNGGKAKILRGLAQGLTQGLPNVLYRVTPCSWVKKGDYGFERHGGTPFTTETLKGNNVRVTLDKCTRKVYKQVKREFAHRNLKLAARE